MNTDIKFPGFAKVIIALQDKAGMKQCEIRDATGLSQPFLSGLKSGYRATIHFESGLKLFSLYAERVLKKKLALVQQA